uniref:ATP synthase F0 subunit 8 n=1 Tax=Panaorus albomaculatus TaxID=300813 RepID=A0A1C9J9W7_9HEMI|nr:ATP synthase F0 subunit 8 [Panaorus albomaculatus]AOP18550.1 ATP synthase F0 subunit 8 [Panaorus albomaculatus]
MPQMSPMWWETLFILFIMLYLMMNFIIYWMNNKNFNGNKEYLKSNNFKWKW